MKKSSIFFLVATFGGLLNVSCDRDIKKFAMDYGTKKFEAYLEESKYQTNLKADSVRNLIAHYAKELPKNLSSEISISKIDTVSSRGFVKSRVYFKSTVPMDSITIVTKVDSIVNNTNPFKEWLKYGEYSRNLEFWCYYINGKNDTIRIATIPTRSY